MCSRRNGILLSPCWTLRTLPPMQSDASRTVTSVKPFSSKVLAAARPAKPAPITTIRGPLLRGSSVPSEEISQLCMPPKVLFDWFWKETRWAKIKNLKKTCHQMEDKKNRVVNIICTEDTGGLHLKTVLTQTAFKDFNNRVFRWNVKLVINMKTWKLLL